MDLVAGLHWLRENLGAFGGDPERLALLGHGTGAALANFLAVSPMAKGKTLNRLAADRAGAPIGMINDRICRMAPEGCKLDGISRSTEVDRIYANYAHVYPFSRPSSISRLFISFGKVR